MNKNKYKILTTCLILLASSCGNNTNTSIESFNSNNKAPQEVSLIAPSGTPLLAMSTYLYENENVKYEVANGSDPLIAAFSSSSHDIIVAPTNLGLNFYNKTSKYVLFETIVWGNLYVASRNPIESFSDLNGKTITLFGTNQTPDILMRTLSAENNITYEVNRVDSVENANALFLQNNAEYVISAEPSLSKIKEKVENLYVLDLQEEWKKMTKTSSYPQASVFVNKEKVASLKDELEKIKNEILTIEEDLEYTSNCALETPLSTLGKNTIKSAIPNCHIGIDENKKEAISFYFEKLLELNLGATFGDKLPDENFYI